MSRVLLSKKAAANSRWERSFFIANTIQKLLELDYEMSLRDEGRILTDAERASLEVEFKIYNTSGKTSRDEYLDLQQRFDRENP